MSDFLAELNQQQRTAVEHLGGPLLVVAGPGTGKTRVITHRIAHRIANGTPAERTLGLTFTTRAASEMRSRVLTLLGADVQPRLGTFHWMCHSLLRRYAHRIGHSRDFRLLSPTEARNALRRVIAGTGPGEQPAIRRVASALSAAKNGAPPALAAHRNGLAPESLNMIMQHYGRALNSARSLDLDDLLYLSARLLREDEPTREACRSWYHEIVVDEFQDTNPVQQELLSLLVPPEGAIVAVGDEDQAIYGWRQVDSRGMRRFLTDFPTAEIIRLSDSYRSTKRILRAAGGLVGHNPHRLGISLQTDNPAGDLPVCIAADDEVEEADLIVAEIARLTSRGAYRAADLAVLYRINAQSRALEDALVRSRIPYHIHAGARFYDRPEVRRVLAYLRLVLGDDDDAAALLASDVSGIGIRRLEHLRQSAAAGNVPLLALLDTPIRGVPRTALSQLQSISPRVRTLRALREAPLGEIVSAAISAAQEGIDFGSLPDADSAVENLNELGTIVRELGARQVTLRDFVDRLSLSDNDHGHGGVNLMSLHASKGLEFPVVFIAGAEEGLLPHRRSLERVEDIEEERRLCYVGMTRARSILYLTYAHGRMLAGQQNLGGASRFIAEIGAANLKLLVSPRRASRPRLASVGPGERVVHPRWGSGTVTALQGSGREALVTIQFDAAGPQRLQLCHAPLTRVGEESVNVLAG